MNNHKDFEQYKRIMRFFSALFLLSIEANVFIYSWFKYYNPELRRPFLGKGNLLMIAVYVLLLCVFMAAFGGLKIGYMKKSNMILAQTLSTISMHVVVLVQIVLIAGKLYRFAFLFWVMFAMTAVDIVIAIICIGVFDWLYYKLFPPRKLLLIFQEWQPETFVQKMKSRKDKFDICEYINIEEGLETIQKKILEFDGVILFDLHARKRNYLLKFCYHEGIRAYTTPKISDIILKNAEILHLFDTPLLLSRNAGLSFEQKMLKRFVDILFCGVFLIVASPFMLLTALAVKLYDRGPALFRQKRVTAYGKEFYVYKFRSMIVNAEVAGVAVLAKKNDARITPVGKFIRATRLDELPQLWNVLKGDMSLIGPRPERPELIEKYKEIMPEFSYRLKVKAGLTGYAQVYGKYNTTVYDKLKLDLMYIENYSLLLDIRIIFQTVKVVFMPDSTEGVEDKSENKTNG